MMISRSKHRSAVEVCADCGASDPSWASINRGLLLCAECCSVHRSMGRHISHVKSLRQGSWPPSLLAMVQQLTAQNVNSIWEHSLLDTSAPKHLRKKPQAKDPLHPIKSEFILAKHLRLAYVLRARRDEPVGELGRQLHSAVRSASLDTAMRLLAQGADPNYYHPEKGSTCLHVACRAGQPAQAELLAAWGADPAARDANHLTPHMAAKQGGHLELADRMTELVYEATDRLIQFVSGARPDHAAGRHFAVPRATDAHEMTDVAKAARGKLQLLPNHLFEELVMDIYDEIDRRETEAIWQTSGTGLERCGVVFLPVNPALSAPRNQGRQKLARLSAGELGALCRDALLDATRRQHIATLQPHALLGVLSPPASRLLRASHASDDEPLYDSVASDDDYAALAPIDLHMSIDPRAGETVSSTYNASLPIEHSAFSDLRPAHSPPLRGGDVDSLKKELDSRDSTITELKNQLKDLQTIVEQLTKENSVLKTTSSVEDNNSLTSQTSITDNVSSNGLDSASKPPERGRSLETDQLTLSSEEADLKQALKSSQRPVSMFEAREGPKNNWHVTKHQVTQFCPVTTMSSREPVAARQVRRRARAPGRLTPPQGGPDPPRAPSDNLGVRALSCSQPHAAPAPRPARRAAPRRGAGGRARAAPAVPAGQCPVTRAPGWGPPRRASPPRRRARRAVPASVRGAPCPRDQPAAPEVRAVTRAPVFPQAATSRPRCGRATTRAAPRRATRQVRGRARAAPAVPAGQCPVTRARGPPRPARRAAPPARHAQVRAVRALQLTAGCGGRRAARRAEPRTGRAAAVTRARSGPVTRAPAATSPPRRASPRDTPRCGRACARCSSCSRRSVPRDARPRCGPPRPARRAAPRRATRPGAGGRARAAPAVPAGQCPVTRAPGVARRDQPAAPRLAARHAQVRAGVRALLQLFPQRAPQVWPAATSPPRRASPRDTPRCGRACARCSSCSRRSVPRDARPRCGPPRPARRAAPRRATRPGAGGRARAAPAVPAGQCPVTRAPGVARRDQPAAPRLAARHAQVRAGVRALLQLFPQTCPDRSLSAVLEQLRAASAALGAACAGAGQLEQLRGAAYDLARATKLLVTHFHQDS
ncbi:ARF GTPase-activating protein GIT1 [Choristoneura fumiferana]|uniref:ARF GTPase-activating protein GIT1 n=1 Tax=Choristoneura fumiferana TaxID=7141 RepID=UPI003D155B1A